MASASGGLLLSRRRTPLALPRAYGRDAVGIGAAQPRHIARRVLFRIAIFGRARPCEHLPQHLDPIVGRLGKGSPNGGQHSAGLVAAERFALPPPPVIASVGTQEPMVRRLFPGGRWIRTI